MTHIENNILRSLIQFSVPGCSIYLTESENPLLSFYPPYPNQTEMFYYIIPNHN